MRGKENLRKCLRKSVDADIRGHGIDVTLHDGETGNILRGVVRSYNGKNDFERKAGEIPL